MNYTVTRTIQPVGQGGFYTEIFDFNNHEKGPSRYCVVYDCGSATRLEPNKTLESALYDATGLDIDILFISHFDDDHVNGVSELAKRHKINRIVIPQIDGYEWYYVLEDSIKRGQYQPRGSFIKDFLDSIKKAVGQEKVHIIPIAPYHLPNEDREIVIGERYSIYGIDDNQILPSGSVLSPFDHNIGWIYIPINTMNLSKIALLKQKLDPIFRSEIPSFSDFDSLSGEQYAKVISAKRRDINEIYREVFGSSNASSMCLYSGLDAVNIQSAIDCQTYSHFYYRPRFLYEWIEDLEGCLYTGDSNLNDSELIRYLALLLKPFKSRIELFQIPHHGSVHNSTEASFDTFSAGTGCHPVLFASYGCYNRYGHPSTRLFGRLRAKGYCICEVTEKKDSYLMEIIHI